MQSASSASSSLTNCAFQPIESAGAGASLAFASVSTASRMAFNLRPLIVLFLRFAIAGPGSNPASTASTTLFAAVAAATNALTAPGFQTLVAQVPAHSLAVSLISNAAVVAAAPAANCF